VTVTLAVSEALGGRLQRAGFPGVQHVTPWAAPPVTSPSPPENSHDLIFLGRLETAKGLDVLLEAFVSVASRHATARLLVAGSGALAPEVARAAAATGGQVVPLGTLDREAVSGLLSSARAVVLPSRSPEGSPLALVEGLVHGRPLVVSDVAGVVEVARTRTANPAGLESKAGDVPSLAAALETVLSDDALVRRQAAAAESWGAQHAEEIGVRRVRECYRLAGAA
jgi:glycosyltransferase involved in cell wall biosynthesis